MIPEDWDEVNEASYYHRKLGRGLSRLFKGIKDMFRDLRVHLNQLGAPAAQIEINNAHADKFEVSWVQFFP